MDPRTHRAVTAQVYDAVGAHGSRPPSGLVCPTGAALARELGYPEEALQRAPPGILESFVGADALAPLVSGSPGDLVLDLGCGAGLDAWLLAREGYRVVAGDASAAMLARLSRARGAGGRDLGAHLAALRVELPHLPVRAGSADWVLLNGVANMVEDRAALWGEVRRALAPGGRLLAADLVALAPLPPEVRALPEAWAWCLAGAPDVAGWKAELESAGMAGVRLTILEKFPPLARARVEAERPRPSVRELADGFRGG
ncbi:MAG: methyltransferase domain-containing protein [Deferrisomatales bacterium]|nr:methyltransferase domain-containing protein [Deferrisomatales bacterium]